MITKITSSPLLESHKLRANPITILVNSFDEKSAADFAKSMLEAQNTGQPVIPIVIDSYGGEVYSLLAMISSIKTSRIPVATIIRGKAMSCGAVLFSFGAEGKRYMDSDAFLMIHDVACGTWGKVGEIKADAKQCEILNKKIYDMMARNCGKPADYFLNMVHERGHADWFLDCAEAMSHNLANKDYIPTLTCKVQVSYSFT